MNYVAKSCRPEAVVKLPFTCPDTENFLELTKGIHLQWGTMGNNTNDGSSFVPKHDGFGVENLVHRNIIVTVILFLDTVVR